MDDSRPPLNWEASANPTNSTVSAGLPAEVAACLRNARFVSAVHVCHPALHLRVPASCIF